MFTEQEKEIIREIIFSHICPKEYMQEFSKLTDEQARVEINNYINEKIRILQEEKEGAEEQINTLNEYLN